MKTVIFMDVKYGVVAIYRRFGGNDVISRGKAAGA
jgi:hypothetical protein